MKPCKSLAVFKYHAYVFDDWSSREGAIMHYSIYAKTQDEARDIMESNVSSGVSWIITKKPKKILERGRMKWNPEAGEQGD